MRQCVDVNYLDFSKAFYRVSHVKLEYLGVKCSLLGLFRSHLRPGRRHRVVIDNESSDFLLVTSGVPQKSILGPLLFSIFINDMPKVIWRETSLPLFADDSIVLSFNPWTGRLWQLTGWVKWLIVTCGMEFNVKKCKVLRVARVRSAVDRDYFPGGIKLDRVAFEKDLWILIIKLE